MAFFEGLVQRCVGGVERVYVWSNRQPWLTVRRVLWVFPLGLGLAALYLVLTGVMLASIVFAPFAYQTFRMALLALDGGITLEPFSQYVVLSLEAPAWGNPAHPYTIAANVVWAVLFGWQLALAHVTAGALQALTIIGIGTALTQWQLAAFAIWPFGRSLRRRLLPTSVEELHAQRAQDSMESSTARALGWL